MKICFHLDPDRKFAVESKSRVKIFFLDARAREINKIRRQKPISQKQINKRSSFRNLL